MPRFDAASLMPSKPWLRPEFETSVLKPLICASSEGEGEGAGDVEIVSRHRLYANNLEHKVLELSDLDAVGAP